VAARHSARHGAIFRDGKKASTPALAFESIDFPIVHPL